MTEDLPIVGDSRAAREWVQGSALPEATKKPLLCFIDRFSGLEFYKESAAAITSIEEREAVMLPQWLREIRQTLAYVMPNRYIRVRFDRSMHPGLHHSDGMWYRLGLLGYYNSENRDTLDLIEGVQLFPIGNVIETMESSLAVNLADDADRRIYEYNIEDLWDDHYDGKPLRESLYVTSYSYADLFGHIVSIEQMGEGGVGRIVRRIDASDINS